MSLMIGLSVERDLIPRHNSVIPNSVCKMYPLYTGLSQQFTITIGQSFCFDVFGNDNESVIGVCNSLCILFDLGISVQLWAIIPVLPGSLNSVIIKENSVAMNYAWIFNDYW